MELIVTGPKGYQKHQRFLKQFWKKKTKPTEFIEWKDY